MAVGKKISEQKWKSELVFSISYKNATTIDNRLAIQMLLTLGVGGLVGELVTGLFVAVAGPISKSNATSSLAQFVGSAIAFNISVLEPLTVR